MHSIIHTTVLRTKENSNKSTQSSIGHIIETSLIVKVPPRVRGHRLHNLWDKKRRNDIHNEAWNIPERHNPFDPQRLGNTSDTPRWVYAAPHSFAIWAADYNEQHEWWRRQKVTGWYKMHVTFNEHADIPVLVDERLRRQRLRPILELPLRPVMMWDVVNMTSISNLSELSDHTCKTKDRGHITFDIYIFITSLCCNKTFISRCDCSSTWGSANKDRGRQQIVLMIISMFKSFR